MPNTLFDNEDDSQTPESPWGSSPPAAPSQSGPQRQYSPTEKAAAVAGFKRGVAQGMIEPNDGLTRLKNMGAVHPDTKVQDLVPSSGPATSNPQAGGAGRDPQASQSYDIYQTPPGGPNPAPATIPGENPWEQNDGGSWHQPQDDDRPPYGNQKRFSPPVNRSPAGSFIDPNTKAQMMAGVNGLTPKPVYGPQTQAQAIASGWTQPPQAVTRDSGTGQTTGASTSVPPRGIQPGNMNPYLWEHHQTTTDVSNKDQSTNTTQNVAQNTADTSNGTKAQSGSVQQLFDPEMYNQRLRAAMGAPPFQQQQGNLNRLQNLLNMQQGTLASAPAQLNLAPAMAYVDSLNAAHGVKSNLAGGYTPPPTPTQEMMQNVGLQQKMFGDQNDLQKSVYENMRMAMPSQTLTDMLALNAMTKNGTLNRTTTTNSDQTTDTNDTKKTTGNMPSNMALQIERMNQIAQRGAQTQVNKDTLLNTYQQRIGGADKILKLMNGADNGDFASTQAMLGQLNSEIAKLEVGTQNPGLQQAEKTEMLDYKTALQNVADTFSGAITPTDLHAKFKQARGMVSDLRKSYVDLSHQRMNLLAGGALASQVPVFDQKAAALDAQLGAVPRTSPKPPPKTVKGSTPPGATPTAPPGSQTAPKTPPAGMTFEQFQAWKRANGQ